MIWKHVRAIVILPITMAVIIPALIVYSNHLDTFALWKTAPILRIVLALLGAIFVGTGLLLMVTTIGLFAKVGAGTLAPWDPTRRLVVRGPYRYVRNPMISGVLSVLLGEALVAASLPLAYWFSFFALANVIYIPFVEELGLVKRFGEDYREYRKNVPRWIPRLTAWQQVVDQPSSAI